MAKTSDRRFCAELDGPFVLFLIGARINRWWKPWLLFPLITTMPRMLAELGARPELGRRNSGRRLQLSPKPRYRAIDRVGPRGAFPLILV